MKIVKPSAELIDFIDTEEIMRKLELCGRVSHQSQPRGDPELFVRMLIKRGHESVLEHVSLTFRIICDRAIMAELTRHRLCAFTVESTRYVKYDELEIVEQGLTENQRTDWLWNLEVAERVYTRLISGAGRRPADSPRYVPPEIARAVLPQCLKSELYMTANLRQWRHILRLRTTKNAHPQMRLIANQILEILRDKLPVIVEDLK